MHRIDQNPNAREFFFYFSQNRQSVGLGHFQVEQQYVGLVVFVQQLDRCFEIVRRSGQGDIRCLLKDQFEPSPDYLVVVHHYYVNHVF